MSLKNQIEAVRELCKNLGVYAPTFEEFKANPDKWRVPVDHVFTSVDESTNVGRKLIEKQKLYYQCLSGKTYECSSLDAVEKLAKDEGVSKGMLDYVPGWEPTKGGRGNSIVVFYCKHDPNRPNNNPQFKHVFKKPRGK